LSARPSTKFWSACVPVERPAIDEVLERLRAG
jgi:hypothetical protein